MNNPLMPLSFTRTLTLRLKVRAESYAWLNAAAIEVNQVFNWANATSFDARRRKAAKAQKRRGRRHEHRRIGR